MGYGDVDNGGTGVECGGDDPVTQDVGMAKSDAIAPLRLAVADNDDFILAALCDLIPKAVPGCVIVWRTTSAATAIERMLDPESIPDMLLLDMSLGVCYKGPQVCRTLRSRRCEAPILGITSYTLHYYAADLADAGGQGIVAKSDLKMIVQGIDAVRHGGTFSPVEGVSFATVPQVLRRLGKIPSSSQVPLSAQENHVMESLSQGMKYSQIAEECNVTESSIRTEAHRAVKKLGAATLSQAVVMWVLGENR